MKLTEQQEVYEAARERTKQKKRLYYHFVIFLIGSVFLVVINKYLNVYPQYDWYLWGIIFWFFLLVIHFINVFVMKRFFGGDWERKQTEKLLLKYNTKITKLEKKLEKQGLISTEDHPDQETD